MLSPRRNSGRGVCDSGKRKKSGKVAAEHFKTPEIFLQRLHFAWPCRRQRSQVSAFADFHTIWKSMFSVANIMPFMIAAVSKYLSGESIPKESGGAKNAKMI